MRRPGFTFLELLIAISLFAVGMISMLQIFSLNRRYLTQSAQTTQAVFLAQEQIETLRGVDYSNLTAGTYEALHAVGINTSDILNQFTRKTDVNLITAAYQEPTTTDIGLKKVSVTVYWSERSVSRQYNLTTYVANR